MAVQKTRILLTNLSTSQETIEEQPSAITAFDVTGLTPSTNYTVKASLMVNDEWTPYTEAYPFTTKTRVNVSSHPVSYDTTDYAWDYVSSTHTIDRGYTDYDSTTYARIYWVKGDEAETYMYFNFNLNIPSNAVIQSVVCHAKSATSTGVSTNVAQRTLQLYSGSTAKGTTKNMTTSSDNIIEFSGSNIGSWTADELNNAKIKVFIKRGSANVENGYYVNFYGATLEVEYLI
jgi:hypothetical protein